MSDTRKAQSGKPAARKDQDLKRKDRLQGEGIQGEGIQGEGDYEAARRFNESEREFVKERGVERQDKLDATEERELEAAEEQGKSRGRELDHEDEDEAIFRNGIERSNSESGRDRNSRH
ncbi:MAG TPA: hypothetical protein VK629_21910 [Steroidobacteraceae bacterium]|nr:hypothetical protein [Steroidobacteraceae bacterium]